MTPEMIRDAYPHLTLSQIHAALSYYHDHKDELDAQIEQGRRFANALRAQSKPSPTKANTSDFFAPTGEPQRFSV